MKPGGGSKKGGSYERRICKALSLWHTRGRRDDVFWRTPMSGGRHTVRKQRGTGALSEVGDICSTDPVSKPFIDAFAVECKSRANMHLHSLFTRQHSEKAVKKHKSHTVYEYWLEIRALAVSVGRLPLLIFHGNHLPDMVLLNIAGRQRLRLEIHPIAHFMGDEDLFVYLLDDFVLYAEQVA